MGYWLVDGSERFDDIEDLCDYLFDYDSYDDDDEVEEYINDVYYDQRVTIGGTEFTPAEIVRNCDDSLWDEIKDEWAESTAESDRDEYYGTLEDMEDGDREYVRSYIVEYFEDEDDDDEEEEEYDPEEEAVIKSLMDHFQKLY